MSSWNTEVNLTYTPVMSNAPLTGRGKHSGAPKPVLILEDSPELSYNLNTTMWQKDNEWSPNNATMTFKRQFFYDNLPEATETVTTVNFPFISVYY